MKLAQFRLKGTPEGGRHLPPAAVAPEAGRHLRGLRAVGIFRVEWLRTLSNTFVAPKD